MFFIGTTEDRMRSLCAAWKRAERIKSDATTNTVCVDGRAWCVNFEWLHDAGDNLVENLAILTAWAQAFNRWCETHLVDEAPQDVRDSMAAWRARMPFNPLVWTR